MKIDIDSIMSKFTAVSPERQAEWDESMNRLHVELNIGQREYFEKCRRRDLKTAELAKTIYIG